MGEAFDQKEEGHTPLRYNTIYLTSSPSTLPNKIHFLNAKAADPPLRRVK